MDDGVINGRDRSLTSRTLVLRWRIASWSSEVPWLWMAFVCKLLTAGVSRRWLLHKLSVFVFGWAGKCYRNYAIFILITNVFISLLLRGISFWLFLLLLLSLGCSCFVQECCKLIVIVRSDLWIGSDNDGFAFFRFSVQRRLSIPFFDLVLILRSLLSVLVRR